MGSALSSTAALRQGEGANRGQAEHPQPRVGPPASRNQSQLAFAQWDRPDPLRAAPLHQSLVRLLPHSATGGQIDGTLK